MHFSWWKWSIDSGDRDCGPFFVSPPGISGLLQDAPGRSGPVWDAPGRSGMLRDALGHSGPVPAGHSAHRIPLLCTNFTPHHNFVHKIPLSCTNFTSHINFVHQTTLSCTNFPAGTPGSQISLSGIKVRVHSYSSCNSSATLPLATSTYRGHMCGRFNNFVELSTHTLVLRHSEWHERGRRIAGTCTIDPTVQEQTRSEKYPEGRRQSFQMRHKFPYV